MGIPITQVRASGGGARSDFWRHLQADIYNAPIVLTNAAEGPAYGVALLAGVGTGVWGSVEEACKPSIRQTAKVAPAKKLAALYDKAYAVYDKLYFDLKDAVPGDVGRVRGGERRCATAGSVHFKRWVSRGDSAAGRAHAGRCGRQSSHFWNLPSPLLNPAPPAADSKVAGSSEIEEPLNLGNFGRDEPAAIVPRVRHARLRDARV